MMAQIVEFFVTLFKVLAIMVIDGFKALLPNGILPRKSVKGDIVCITGSGSGLGRMMALEFGKLGAELVLWDVNEAGNTETKKMLEASGVKVHAYTVDLSQCKSINAVAKKTLSDVGRIDILVNNAGIVTGKKLFDCPDELMEKTMAVNSTSHFFTAKNFLPSMLDRNHGHIVTLASMAGKTGVAGLVDYCASKHAAVGFHESLTSELRSLRKDGVKTTCVCPFFIDTGMFDGVQTKSPTLLPILKPEYVIECIMEAVLTDREYILMPRFCYLAVFVSSFLPSRATALTMDFFGANETMDNFKGRHNGNGKH